MTEVEKWLRETLGPPAQRDAIDVWSPDGQIDATDAWPCGCLVSVITSIEDGSYLLSSHVLCDEHREECHRAISEEEAK